VRSCREVVCEVQTTCFLSSFRKKEQMDMGAYRMAKQFRCPQTDGEQRVLRDLEFGALSLHKLAVGISESVERGNPEEGVALLISGLVHTLENCVYLLPWQGLREVAREMGYQASSWDTRAWLDSPEAKEEDTCDACAAAKAREEAEAAEQEVPIEAVP
jgi:hypothetical protein